MNVQNYEEKYGLLVDALIEMYMAGTLQSPKELIIYFEVNTMALRQMIHIHGPIHI